jgi:hypothetical protein
LSSGRRAKTRESSLNIAKKCSMDEKVYINLKKFLSSSRREK